jgi:colanic acid/amylovoran biosynthesis glycosyltransferase
VVHAVDVFLTISENWIYPQIVDVPGVQTKVFCREVINRECFPLPDKTIILQASPPDKALGFPKIFNALARRLGSKATYAGLSLRSWRPHVLHAHFGPRGWETLALKSRLNIPLVTSFYGYDAWMLPQTEPVWLKRYEQCFSKGEAFLVEGPAMRNRLVDLGCPKGKIILQRIGVSLDSLSYQARNFENGLKIVMVGRFVEKKGLVDGLRACALASQRGANVSITVIGDVSNTDTGGSKVKRELESIAESPELAGKVCFTGILPLNETRELLRKHNVFLCPSKHAASGDAEGGSPVALTEAMATGLLCVGTGHCDIPELIMDGETGYLCKEGDVAGMSEIVCGLKNSDKLLELTLAGRRHVEKHFSLPIQIDKLRLVYESLLNTN